MSSKYVTMTEIGKAYGATSHEVGHWLNCLGYRSDGRPTEQAFSENMTKQLPSRNPGTYVWGWDQDRGIEIFKMMEYRSEKR